jgi:hypothetical protein
MRISPPLLLLMLLIFIFTPAIHDWITNGGSAWYRPYIIWLCIIVFVFWSQRRHSPDEL